MLYITDAAGYFYTHTQKNKKQFFVIFDVFDMIGWIWLTTIEILDIAFRPYKSRAPVKSTFLIEICPSLKGCILKRFCLLSALYKLNFKR